MTKVTERQTVETWRLALARGAPLQTEAGELFRVVYPGRAGGNGGADFQDAVIATGSGLVRGDIEVHARASDWRAHGHQDDPSYNRVILHIVMFNDAPPAVLECGSSIPVMALDKLVIKPRGIREGGFATPCARSPERFSPDYIAGVLEAAGDERFRAKADEFRARISAEGASQALYRGIMGALGYSANKRSFQELGSLVPIQSLEFPDYQALPEERLAGRQALLLGTAGLLPGGKLSPDAWTARLERLWSESPSRNAMPASAWRLNGIRPANYPARRIAAISYLAARYEKKGILGGLMASLLGDWRAVEAALAVGAEGYWGVHYGFGLSLPRTPLIGAGRAAQIAVNALLPFAAAWSGQEGLAEKALALYRVYPAREPNGLEGHVRCQAGIPGRLVSFARRQQGLLHIYKALCTQGECGRCPLAELSPYQASFRFGTTSSSSPAVFPAASR